jgi:hypothetical protein
MAVMEDARIVVGIDISKGRLDVACLPAAAQSVNSASRSFRMISSVPCLFCFIFKSLPGTLYPKDSHPTWIRFSRAGHGTLPGSVGTLVGLGQDSEGRSPSLGLENPAGLDFGRLNRPFEI